MKSLQEFVQESCNTKACKDLEKLEDAIGVHELLEIMRNTLDEQSLQKVIDAAKKEYNF